MSLNRINTRALASLEVSELFPPLLFCVPFSFFSRIKAAFDSASYRAPAQARSQTQRFLVLDGRRRHLLTLSLTPISRTPRSACLGSLLHPLLGLGSSYPGPILITLELFEAEVFFSLSLFDPFHIIFSSLVVPLEYATVSL